MLKYVAACFAITLVASLVGFGGVVASIVAITKALAVIFLVLFFVGLFRLLYENEPTPSIDS